MPAPRRLDTPLNKIVPPLLLKVLVPLVRVKLPATPMVPEGAVTELFAKTATALRFKVPELVAVVVPPKEAVPDVALTIDPEPTETLPFTRNPAVAVTSCKKFRLLKVGAIAPENVLDGLPAAKLNVEEARLMLVPPLVKLPARLIIRLVPPSLNVPADTIRFPLLVMLLFNVSVFVPSLVRLFRTEGDELIGSSGPGVRATLLVYCTSYLPAAARAWVRTPVARAVVACRSTKPPFVIVTVPLLAKVPA